MTITPQPLPAAPPEPAAGGPFFLWPADPDGGWSAAVPVGPFDHPDAARAAVPAHVPHGGRFVVLPAGRDPRPFGPAPGAAGTGAAP